MKNNQFKREIKKLIEAECKVFDFISLYVDETKNRRMIYIFTLDYKYVGMFSCWLNSENIHLSFTNLKNLSIMQYKVKDVCVKYKDFDIVVETIQEAFSIMEEDNAD